MINTLTVHCLYANISIKIQTIYIKIEEKHSIIICLHAGIRILLIF